MALISDIAHCNGVISQRGKDKGVCWNVLKHQPTGAADVPKKPTQYSHSIARGLYYNFDTVNCQKKLEIFLFSCPLTLSSPSLSLCLNPSLTTSLQFSFSIFHLFFLSSHFQQFCLFSVFVSLLSLPVLSHCCPFHFTISSAVCR